MLRLNRIIAIDVVVVVVIIILNSGTIRTIVSSESPPHFCSYSSKTSTCPGDEDLVEISYPFWIENRTTDADGDCISYPGFQVKCAANGRPVLNISNNLYYVLSTDSGSIRVVDVDIDAHECPQPRRIFSIDSAPFLSYDDRYEAFLETVNITIFYNCSGYSQNVVQHMPCLDNYSNNTSTTDPRSFAFTDQELSSHQFDWYENCEEAVVVHVNKYYIDESYSIAKNYTRALKNGFYIQWSCPVNCGNCVLSGGKCWANETNITTTPFHCDCPGGTYSDGVDDICRGPYYSSYCYGEDAYVDPDAPPMDEAE